MSWAKLRMVRGMAERRALRRLERRAAKSAQADTTEMVASPPSLPMAVIREAVAAGNMVAKAAQAVAAPRRAKIDIAAAPSGMEAAAAEISKNSEQEKPTADDASGCEGGAAEVLSGPAPVDGLVADPPMVAVKARQSRVEHQPREPRPFPAPACPPKRAVRAVAIPIEALKDRPAARPSNGRSVGAQYDARALGLTVWCDQCERMVKREKALRCPSRFCKAKSAASAPIRRAL